MPHASLFAEPWWVNLFVLIPFIAYGFFRKGLAISSSKLIVAAIYAAAMGFLEAAVVVYLRAATGLLPDGKQTPSPHQVLNDMTRHLFTIEIYREVATIVMLVAVALLAVEIARERWAIFLWTFAIWDITYYIGLWLTIGWPPSLATTDVLFLMPTPWIAEVWFPVLVSGLCMAAVVAGQRKARR